MHKVPPSAARPSVLRTRARELSRILVHQSFAQPYWRSAEDVERALLDPTFEDVARFSEVFSQLLFGESLNIVSLQDAKEVFAAHRLRKPRGRLTERDIKEAGTPLLPQDTDRYLQGLQTLFYVRCLENYAAIFNLPRPSICEVLRPSEHMLFPMAEAAIEFQQFQKKHFPEGSERWQAILDRQAAVARLRATAATLDERAAALRAGNDHAAAASEHLTTVIAAKAAAVTELQRRKEELMAANASCGRMVQAAEAAAKTAEANCELSVYESAQLAKLIVPDGDRKSYCEQSAASAAEARTFEAQLQKAQSNTDLLMMRVVLLTAKVKAAEAIGKKAAETLSARTLSEGKRMSVADAEILLQEAQKQTRERTQAVESAKDEKKRLEALLDEKRKLASAKKVERQRALQLLTERKEVLIKRLGERKARMEHIDSQLHSLCAQGHPFFDRIEKAVKVVDEATKSKEVAVDTMMSAVGQALHSLDLLYGEGNTDTSGKPVPNVESRTLNEVFRDSWPSGLLGVKPPPPSFLTLAQQLDITLRESMKLPPATLERFEELKAEAFNLHGLLQDLRNRQVTTRGSQECSLSHRTSHTTRAGRRGA